MGLVLVFLESIRLSQNLSDVLGVLLAMIIATAIPGLGTFGKMINILPPFNEIYRNSK
jgi:hypothetical protein